MFHCSLTSISFIFQQSGIVKWYTIISENNSVLFYFNSECTCSPMFKCINSYFVSKIFQYVNG